MNGLRSAIVRGARRTRRRGDGLRAPRVGDGYEFAQLRGYVEGDDPRRIDWAASARVGGLQTRVFLEETSLVLAAFVDDSGSMHVGRKRRLSDAADEALRAWFGAAESDDRTQRIVDDRIVNGTRPALHVRPARPFDLLRTLTFAAHVLPRGASLLALTDAFDLPAGAAELLLRVAARCDATVLLARDPWHDGLPLRGLRRVRDAESGRSRVLYFGARQRRRYVEAVARRDRALQAQFVNAGWRVGELDEANGRASLERAFGLSGAPAFARSVP
ncbi:MAG: DUF58 domain-containing protein [Candidatus Velthaea sp.]|jgi:uncharacterized protein (DUF58 family)